MSSDKKKEAVVEYEGNKRLELILEAYRETKKHFEKDNSYYLVAAERMLLEAFIGIDHGEEPTYPSKKQLMEVMEATWRTNDDLGKYVREEICENFRYMGTAEYDSDLKKFEGLRNDYLATLPQCGKVKICMQRYIFIYLERVMRGLNKQK